jgi:hypothetical protein
MLLINIVVYTLKKYFIINTNSVFCIQQKFCDCGRFEYIGLEVYLTRHIFVKSTNFYFQCTGLNERFLS